MLYKASAPGSLMLLGEYAVLHGKPALVCAVDKRIHVTLTPNSDDTIEIYSDTHGQYQTNLSQLTIEKPFQYVLGALKQYEGKMRRGCRIDIRADFSDQIGFGSSAAVTVATLATLAAWQRTKMTPQDLLRQGRMAVRTVQGVGSGADVAASVYGGIVGYQMQPLAAERIAITHPIIALYAGFKTPTTEAIKQVQTRFAPHPEVFRHLCHAIGQCAQEGIAYARKQDWQALGAIMNIQQGLMESLCVSLPMMRDMIDHLRKQPQIVGAKISGSGMGDCVVALGEVENQFHHAQHIAVNMTLQGVKGD